MDKDQYHIQTLRTLYLHGILLPWVLFIAKRSALKRASWWSLKQIITSSSFQDISNLVSGDLVIANWSADNSVNTDCLETFLVPFERSFQGLLVAIYIVEISQVFLELWSEWSLWQIQSNLLFLLIHSYLISSFYYNTLTQLHLIGIYM